MKSNMIVDAVNGGADYETRVVVAAEDLAKGDIVGIDYDSTAEQWQATKSATAALGTRIWKVANEDAVAGDPVSVVWSGPCDFASCAETEDIVASTDICVYAIDGGLCAGATQAEINADDGTILCNVIGMTAGVSSGTTGEATIIVTENAPVADLTDATA
jgi:hypothetical protein